MTSIKIKKVDFKVHFKAHVIVSLHMALGDDKTDNTQDFFYLNKLEIAERMYKICIFVIVLGLGAPMVSLRVFVQ